MSRALESLLEGGGSRWRSTSAPGAGVSNREVLDAIARVTGRPVPHRIGQRRPGDPPELVADPSLAEHEARLEGAQQRYRHDRRDRLALAPTQ